VQNLNVHFHSLDDEARLLPLPAPDDAGIARVTARVARGIARPLARANLPAGRVSL
jgi:hypothetical protein